MLYARKDGNTGRKQTLKAHSKAVATLCGGFGKPVGLENLAYLAGMLHDMGKAGQAFQAYLELQPEEQVRGSIDHSTAGAKWLYEQAAQGGFLNRLTAQLVSLAVCSHHGGLPDCIGPDGTPVYETRMQKDAEIGYRECVADFFAEVVSEEEIQKRFAAAQQEVERLLLRIREAAFGLPAETALWFFLGLTERFLFSCLLDADRLDAAGRLPEEEGPPWRAFCERLEAALRKFPAEQPVDRQRKYVSEACLQFAQKPPGIYRLSVPTGGGKTLSSLRFALHHGEKYGT